MKSLHKFIFYGAIFVLLLSQLSCGHQEFSVNYSFDNVPERIWIGEDFWTIPLEDWRIKEGRIECNSAIVHARMSMLTHVISGKQGDFSISVDMGMLEEGINKGIAGIIIGVEDEEDDDVRAAVFFGKGVSMGVSTEGYAFIDQQTKTLPVDFDYRAFTVKVSGGTISGVSNIDMVITDVNGNLITELSMQPAFEIKGIVQLVNNMHTGKSRQNGPRFWFDNLTIGGSKFENRPENRFGPVLWTMYTLSENILKLSAQLPPLGEADNKEVDFQVMNNGKWKTLTSGSIDPDARLVTFKMEGWDPTRDMKYRVSHSYINAEGKRRVGVYDGTIKKDPVDRPLRMGTLTCQFHSGFPYSPLVKNLTLSKPDLLYFSGDQIYESNGGYPRRRSPEETAILSYLGKWYMFGWAFGDLMRNVPTVCTPDDHDVFQGNLWGQGGIPSIEHYKIDSTDNLNSGRTTGFVQTIGFVNMVNRTQCAHLPDPYDPAPIDRGMSVWYTGMKYGRVSFAIISDRIFKTGGPERFSDWRGRNDPNIQPVKDIASFDGDEFTQSGQRQEDFLNHWIRDWSEADMKVLLSQTVFAHVSTHQAGYDNYTRYDIDTGGWPKTARDQVIRLIRKAYTFHITGDQHLSTLTHYGVDEYRDAGWAYCTPAISIIMSRWFRPDDLNLPVRNRPAHGLPNTGEYRDAFGNLNYVYAVGNSENYARGNKRYEFEQAKSAGFGMVIYDKETRDISIESWKFLADVTNPGPNDQHPGWPFTISQFDNYGREAKAWLPNLKVIGEPNPVVEIINEHTGETEYIVRIKGNEFSPKVFSVDLFTIRIGYPESELWKTFENIVPTALKDEKILGVDFQ